MFGGQKKMRAFSFPKLPIGKYYIESLSLAAKATQEQTVK